MRKAKLLEFLLRAENLQILPKSVVVRRTIKNSYQIILKECGEIKARVGTHKRNEDSYGSSCQKSLSSIRSVFEQAGVSGVPIEIEV